MHTSTGRSSTPRVAARDLTAPWHHVDGVLAAVVGVILVMGSVMVYGATRYTEAKTGLVVRHVGFIVVGVALGVFVATVDYRRLLAWWPFLYGGSVLLLLGVLTPLGATVNGTSGWYRLGPLSFQPAGAGQAGHHHLGRGIPRCRGPCRLAATGGRPGTARRAPGAGARAA